MSITAYMNEKPKSQVFRVSTGLTSNGAKALDYRSEIVLLIEYSPISKNHYHLRASLYEGTKSVSKREDYGSATIENELETIEALYLELAEAIAEKALETTPHGRVAQWLQANSEVTFKVIYA